MARQRLFLRPAFDLLAQYAEYHRDQRNIVTHQVGIPLIVFALGVLLARPVLALEPALPLTLTPAWVAWAAATAWYLTRGEPLLGAAFASWGSRLRALLWPAAVVVVVALLMPHNNWQVLLYLLGLGTVILWLALYGLWLPRVPARMGDWSYGAYLYGFPVQQVLAHFKLHETSFVAFVVTSTALTFALAGLSWHCVEKQAMRWK